MRPIMRNSELTIELHQLDIRRLKAARELGEMLVKLHQPEGQALIDAIEAIDFKFLLDPVFGKKSDDDETA